MFDSRDDRTCELTEVAIGRQLQFIFGRLWKAVETEHGLWTPFDENLTFSDQISSLSKSCYCHIRELRCIRPYLDSKTASTIAASIVILRMPPHHSHHLRYHHLSLPRPFTPDLKLISFTNPFLHRL